MDPQSVAIGAIVKGLFDVASRFASKAGQKPARAQDNLSNYLREIECWSNTVHLYSMSKSKTLNEATVRLDIASEPRRFGKPTGTTQVCDEIDLIGNSKSIVLLGDPGGGKTTTLKRITRQILLSEPQSDFDIFQYPLVVRLKDDPSLRSLWVKIAEIAGFSVEWRERSPGEGRFFIGDTHVENFITDYLNESRPIILVDGLDEIDSTRRSHIEAELVSLDSRLIGPKIIVTCRSGDYTKIIAGFDIYEIIPLSPAKVSLIAQMWTDASAEFIRSLNSQHYSDLATRPLFLICLIIIFDSIGYLPEQSAEVIEKSIDLIIQKWDQEKSVKRTSKYAGFTPHHKIRFLSSLAYQLTYSAKSKLFTRRDLVKIYAKIHGDFDLPASEAEIVAAEIEGHTGIIIDAGAGRFEFCHLSIQEYLVAYYLVREPYSEHLGAYMSEYPAPVALAVSLSSKPSSWFAGIILNPHNKADISPEMLQSFLSRVLVERPHFSPSLELGLAVLQLEFEANASNDVALACLVDQFLVLERCRSAAEIAIRWYAEEPTNLSFVQVKRKYHALNHHGLRTPEGGLLRKSTYNTILPVSTEESAGRPADRSVI